ncbi:MAG TPA: hypothetical protein VFL10_00210 [Ornithinibacter sp.]|nr:hypothetical protein [Ornithinibacter sp.]
MRWEGLFADLEGQLAAEQRRERDDEVAERTRRERALVTLPARLAAAVGAPMRISLSGGHQVDGALQDLGEDWVLVRTTPDAHEVLVPIAAVVTLRSLGSQSAPARTARRFGLGYALRALSRDRATVVVSVHGDGPRLLGTIDAVGADHLDLAEHLDGLPRRRENVRAVATVPFAALVAVESRR